jgi:hypothetical protein
VNVLANERRNISAIKKQLIHPDSFLITIYWAQGTGVSVLNKHKTLSK